MEEDLLLKAGAVFQSGQPQVVVYDTTDENDLVWGVGLGCHGIVHLVVERVLGLPIQLTALKNLWQRRQPGVLATAFGAEKSAIARMIALYADDGLISGDGASLGKIGVEMAEKAFAAQAREYAVVAISGESVQVLFEYLPPPFCLNIFGAGDDAQPLSRFAKELGWIVRIFDPRPAYATRERFPEADEVVLYRGEAPDVAQIDRWSAAVVMTHHYRYDVPLLRAVLPTPAPYFGLLGPKKRAEKIFGDLESQGFVIDPSMRARLRAPVGLDLGSTSPEQVALSIIAEIEASLNKRDGRPLRERTRPIHG